MKTISEVKFTPGPWTITGATQVVKTGPDWAWVGVACNPRGETENPCANPEPADISNPRFDEACANARLIASAPDLLAALRDCQDFLDAIVTATEGAGQIDKDSIMRYGERLKTTARKLNTKALAIITSATKGTA